MNDNTENNTPLGSKQNFCSTCGAAVSAITPEGDNRLRYVCSKCDTVHYENPKMVVGCVVEHKGKILLCRRAIEPRYDKWTIPAGFMELGETLEAAAARETREEACGEVALDDLLAVVDVVHAGQVHIFFRGTLIDGKHSVGEESLDTALYSPADIPWDEIAFPSGIIALQRFLHFKETGDTAVFYTQAERMPVD